MYSDYENRGPTLFLEFENNYDIIQRPYDIVEIILIVITIIENIIKFRITTKPSSKVYFFTVRYKFIDLTYWMERGFT
jgi:hypothetical protein